jgi:hypothetical protein
VRVISIAGLNGLLGGKIPLLVLGNRHQGGKWIVLFRHAHILNFFEELCKSSFGWNAVTNAPLASLHGLSRRPVSLRRCPFRFANPRVRHERQSLCAA